MKVLHLDTNHPLLLQTLQDAGFTNIEDYHSSKQEIQKNLSGVMGIVLRSRFPIDQAFIDSAPDLKFIARVGAGLENIDENYAASKGIRLIAAPEGNRNAVGEHTLAMLLSLFNKLNAADRDIRSGNWNREAHRGHELDGKTVGIIGYGNMGKAFARKLRGFDVEILCVDLIENMGDSHVKQVSLSELQEKADIISLHVPYTSSTDKMINETFIRDCRKPFWLINTSRGKNVATDALTAGLKSGKILGAALDVLEYEKSSFENLFDGEMPASLRYLIEADNVLLSPHVAGWTFESHEKLASVIARKIIEFATGKPENNPETPRATGLGGIFFKAKDPKALAQWYRTHLGLPTDEYGWTFRWLDQDETPGMTQWSPFDEKTTYFSPSEKPFMQNFRVNDLHRLLDNLRREGVHVFENTEAYSYGNFGWILDPEGNKIELWEPKDAAL